MARGRAGRAALSHLLATTAHHREVTGASYTGLVLAVLVGWIGVPGTGEVGLVAAAVVAGRGRLDITLVLALAWASAMVGGLAGWGIGLTGGRPLVLARGPFRRTRRRALAAVAPVFDRHPLLAVYFAPSWAVGVEQMRPSRFLPANLVASLLWTLLVGFGGFFVGRPVIDAVSDLGTIGLVVLAALVLGGVVARRIRRRAGREG